MNTQDLLDGLESTLGEDGDSAASALVRSVAAARAQLASTAASEAREVDVFREMAVAAVLRAARRVYWVYLRQSWDDPIAFAELLVRDEEDERMHKTVGSLFLFCFVQHRALKRLMYSLAVFGDSKEVIFQAQGPRAVIQGREESGDKLR
jgi:hypothetical protein